MKSSLVKTGLERLVEGKIAEYSGAKAALLVNPTSITSQFKHSIDILHENRHVDLVKLFAPEHGIRADAQDMVKVDHEVDSCTGLPVFSLYQETTSPVPDQVKDIDIIFFDIQDVGSRYYTFIYSLANTMKTAAGQNCRIVVLDRPNPITGTGVEGPVLKAGYESFVGLYPIAVRHGMTVGELAVLFNRQFDIGCNLDVITMTGWKRHMDFHDTGLPWVLPSPNMPTLDTALVYPGMCLLEGTNISEGRGTTRPFEMFGAPYINPVEFSESMENLGLPGVVFRPLNFIPTFHKWHGKVCGGAQIHVLNRKTFKPFITGIAIIREIHRLYPGSFQWRQPPYEYETIKLPIDILTGDPQIRQLLEANAPLNEIEAFWQQDLDEFLKLREQYLMYE